MDKHIRWRTGPGKTDKLDMEAWTRKQITKCKGDEVLSAKKCCPPNSDVSMCFNEHSIYCACTEMQADSFLIIPWVLTKYFIFQKCMANW